MTRQVIANWKMNFSIEQAINFCNNIKDTNCDSLIIAAPLVYLAYLRTHFPDLTFAAQDVSSISESYGSFTGETSAKMLSDLGIKYCIVGHSERRKYNNETNTSTKTKAELCIKHNIIPIICIGEEQKERDNNQHLEYIKSQLLESLPKSNDFILAYEPLWSIGTGNIPNNTQLEEVFSLFENIIAKPLALVYGGSINSDNAGEIAKVSNINGLLVGKSSLDIEELQKIIKAW
jgi:triosephosphate isomerase (TIM)